MPPSDLLIDDFEDGDDQLMRIAGRDGSWFVSNDGSYRSQQTPDPGMDTLPSLLAPPRGTSTRAMHTTGSGFTNWGALIGANFLMGTTPSPYDISAHQGLTFAAKIGNPMAARLLRVSIRNYDTLYGCTDCGDHFGAPATLGEAFQTIIVPFSSFKQQGWGKPQMATFDATRTYAVTFVWAARQNFDVWIDDLSFY
jgi:hypothetical protein